jgi:hypothetical protein
MFVAESKAIYLTVHMLFRDSRCCRWVDWKIYDGFAWGGRDYYQNIADRIAVSALYGFMFRYTHAFP